MLISSSFLGGGSIQKSKFKEMARRYCQLDVSDAEVDIIYRIFDQDSDGILDTKSLKFLYENRYNTSPFQPSGPV